MALADRLWRTHEQKLSCVQNYDMIYIQTDNDWYFSSQPNGNLDVVRSALGSWEKYMVQVDNKDEYIDDCIEKGDTVHLLGLHPRLLLHGIQCTLVIRISNGIPK